MHPRDQLIDLLYKFLDAGLVSKDLDKLLNCFSPDILGIGLGEQGFVTNHEEIIDVMSAGLKADDPCVHELVLGRTEVKLHSDDFATICAHVFVNSFTPEGQASAGMNFFQLLTAKKIADKWKICALHASTPILTEEELESYPLKIAEKTLQSLKKKIGEQAYLAEEQYRQAILSDTIAFYIVNFTLDQFEKCQCDSDICAYAEEGSSYDAFLQAQAPKYLTLDNKYTFLNKFSKQAILSAIEQGQSELSLEYQLERRDGTSVWVQTIMRLIKDVSTDHHKGIFYVRNIDKRKQEEINLQTQATTDGMTCLYNKMTMVSKVTNYLNDTSNGGKCCMAILDIDNFKDINDKYGHPVGDRALVEVANALRKNFTQKAYLGRIGGDEFSIFLKDLENLDHTKTSFDNFMNDVIAISIMDYPLAKITCSIGAVIAPCNKSYEYLYKYADKALYQSKNNGKKQLTLIQQD